MKVLNYFESEARTSTSYEAPAMESIEIRVERGFEASFGDAGYAGDDYDINDNGSF